MDIVRFSMPSPSPRPPDAVLGSCGDDGNRKLLDIGNDLKLPAAAATSAFCASTASCATAGKRQRLVGWKPVWLSARLTVTSQGRLKAVWLGSETQRRDGVEAEKEESPT